MIMLAIIIKTVFKFELLVNQFNNATPENRNDPEKISSSKYYDIEEMHNIEIPDNNKSLSLFDKNAFSLNKNLNKNFLQLRLLQVVPFFTLLIINHINVSMT